jgi:hypothetical protein
LTGRRSIGSFFVSRSYYSYSFYTTSLRLSIQYVYRHCISFFSGYHNVTLEAGAKIVTSLISRKFKVFFGILIPFLYLYLTDLQELSVLAGCKWNVNLISQAFDNCLKKFYPISNACQCVSERNRCCGAKVLWVFTVNQYFTTHFF